MLNERQMSILTYITEHGEAKNTALQSLIGDCSMMTLWRDLTKLEQKKTLPGLPQIWYIRAMHIIWTRGPQF